MLFISCLTLSLRKFIMILMESLVLFSETACPSVPAHLLSKLFRLCLLTLPFLLAVSLFVSIQPVYTKGDFSNSSKHPPLPAASSFLKLLGLFSKGRLWNIYLIKISFAHRQYEFRKGRSTCSFRVSKPNLGHLPLRGFSEFFTVTYSISKPIYRVWRNLYFLRNSK